MPSRGVPGARVKCEDENTDRPVQGVREEECCECYRADPADEG